MKIWNLHLIPFVLSLVLVSIPSLAEPHDLKPTPEEQQSILKERETKSRAVAEAKELKLPNGLGVEDIDLACRKHKILDGLKNVNRRAEALSKEVSSIGDQRHDEEKLKTTCIDVSNLAGVANGLMNSLAERKRGDARVIARDSVLYSAGVNEYGAPEINTLCKKIVASASLTSTGELTSTKDNLSKLLSKMATDTRQAFISSVSENSHKR